MMLALSFSPAAAAAAASRAVARPAGTRTPAHCRRAMSVAAWSGSLSHATPESDFCATTTTTTAWHWQAYDKQQPQKQKQQQQHFHLSTWVWSHSYSFAAPESDFTASLAAGQSRSRVLVSPFAPPTMPPHEEKEQQQQQPQQQLPNWSHTLCFASPESDFTTSHVAVVDEPQFHHHRRLPTTLAEALHETERAVVVTTVDAPHRIIHVNRAWEDLCGYTKEQVLHRTLQLIQGPETNPQLILQAVADVVHAHQPQSQSQQPSQQPSQQQGTVQRQPEEKEVYVVNYKRDGTKFINHLTLGPLALHHTHEPAPAQQQAQRSSLDFLVGILEPVSREQVPLRLATAGY